MKAFCVLRAITTIAVADALLILQSFSQPLPNAWQITDSSSTGPSGGSYATNLSGTQPTAALTNGWRYSVTARLLDDFGGSGTMVFLYGVDTNRFSIFWDLDAGGNLIAWPFNQLALVLTTNGIGARLYHTHEIVYNPTNRIATYLYDGVVKTNWAGDGVTETSGRVAWGSGSTAGKGQMNFNAISFLIGTNVVAAYSAGVENNPTNAPDPRKQGWTVNPATGADTNGISPDLLPSATTLPADQFLPTSARLNGTADPNGSPAMALFEWGTNLAYGNVTALQPVGAGIDVVGVSNVIGGLVPGTDYYFRVVVSNQFGVAAGANKSFIQPGFVQTSIPSLPGVSGSSVAWGDYDRDGRLDFVLTGATSASTTASIWHNTGGGFTNLTSSLAQDLPEVQWSSVAWGDYNNDGRLDLLLTGELAQQSFLGTTTLWRNTEEGFTNVIANVATGILNLFRSNVAWGDYDNDGRLDFLLTGTTNFHVGSCQLWRNTGAGFSNVTASATPGLLGVYNSSVAWGDYDNDGRLDFLSTGQSSTGQVSQLWRNTGSGFSNVTASVAAGLPSVSFSSVAWGDYDNDGRLDFLITGGSSSGSVSQLWRNTGSGFSNVTASVAPGLPGVSQSSVAWGDYDNDGRLDFLITGFSSTGRVSQVWRNTGSGFSNVTASVAPGLPGVAGSSVAWGDFDNDGRLDFLLTGHDGSNERSQLWRNNMPISNAPPAAPTGLASTISGDTVTLNWNAPADDFTPPAGLNYNLRIGVVPGGSSILAPQALTNGTRLVPARGNAQNGTSAFYQLPAGTYYWSVQTVDTSFAGSPFATEQQFTLRPVLRNSVMLPGGVFRFQFAAQPGPPFSVFATTNVSLPFTNWMLIGAPIPMGNNLFQFTDSAPSQSRRFYLVRQP